MYHIQTTNSSSLPPIVRCTHPFAAAIPIRCHLWTHSCQMLDAHVTWQTELPIRNQICVETAMYVCQDTDAWSQPPCVQ